MGTRLLLRLVLLSAVFAAMSGCAVRQTKAVDVAPVVAFASGVQATSVEVSKLLVAIPDGKVYGRPHQGLACLGNPPLVWKGGTSTISEGPLLARVVDVLSSAGLKLSQSRDELFATPDKQGDLVLAGKIVDLEWVTCGEYTYSGRKGSAYVAIEWQVFSRAAGAVLLTTRTEGSFATEEFKPSNNNVVFLAGAVESAAKNLLANPDFRKLLTVSPPRSNPRMT